MSKGKDMPVLVMDVEGTDGRERGEDQVSGACDGRNRQPPSTLTTTCSGLAGL